MLFNFFNTSLYSRNYLRMNRYVNQILLDFDDRINFYSLYTLFLPRKDPTQPIPICNVKHPSHKKNLLARLDKANKFFFSFSFAFFDMYTIFSFFIHKKSFTHEIIHTHTRSNKIEYLHKKVKKIKNEYS